MDVRIDILAILYLSSAANLHSIGGDGAQEEAGAVGRADGGGRETIAGTGDGTVAVVAGAGALLDSHAGESHGHEGEDDGELHFE